MMIPKFRAWDKKHKEICEVWQIHFDLKFVHCFNKWARNLKFEDCILMQSTGLFDKNGVEIFEGDIVKVTDLDECTNCTDCGIGYVEYLDVFGFYNITEIENSIHELAFQGHTIEIIGNIYENPELLEVEE